MYDSGTFKDDIPRQNIVPNIPAKPVPDDHPEITNDGNTF